MRMAIIVTVALGLAALSSSPRADFFDPWIPLDIVEQVFRDSALVEYFHVEVPGRLPILVSSTFSPPELEELHLGYAVKLVRGDSPEASRAFQFTKVEISENHAVVDVSYPPEGIRGRFKFVRNGERWTLKSRKIWEN